MRDIELRVITPDAFELDEAFASLLYSLPSLNSYTRTDCSIDPPSGWTARTLCWPRIPKSRPRNRRTTGSSNTKVIRL
jgi:hypothetical protein